jgi:hypothetical protein
LKKLQNSRGGPEPYPRGQSPQQKPGYSLLDITAITLNRVRYIMELCRASAAFLRQHHPANVRLSQP